MERITKFKLPEHTNTLYEREAISSISLTKEVADKINELVDGYNELSQLDLEWKQTQEGTIRKAVVYMKDNLLNSLNDLMVVLRDSGFIDDRIEFHCDNLKEDINNITGRLNNLLGRVKEGTTTMDAEVIDGRFGANGVTYSTIGGAIRDQLQHKFGNRYTLKDDDNGLSLKPGVYLYNKNFEWFPDHTFTGGFLFVFEYEDTEQGNNHMTIEVIMKWTDMSTWWIRRVRDNSNVDFPWTIMENDHAFINRGTIGETDDGLSLKPGIYLYNQNKEWFPDETYTGGFILVFEYGDNPKATVNHMTLEIIIKWTDLTNWKIRRVREKTRVDFPWTDLHKTRFGSQTLTILGDSISAEGTYQDYMLTKYGIKTDTHAIPGASWGLNGDETVDSLSVIRQVDNIADFSNKYWLLFAGTNDWGGRYTQLGDINSTDTTTVAGGMNYVINKILSNNPEAKIVVANILYRTAGEEAYTGEEQNAVNITLKQYSDTITSVAESYKLPVIDLYNKGFINKANYKTYLQQQENSSGFYWLHPTAKGHELLADIISNFITVYM